MFLYFYFLFKKNDVNFLGDEIDMKFLFSKVSELLVKVRNFYSICHSFEKGDFNYKLHVKEEQSDR